MGFLPLSPQLAVVINVNFIILSACPFVGIWWTVFNIRNECYSLSNVFVESIKMFIWIVFFVLAINQLNNVSQFPNVNELM